MNRSTSCHDAGSCHGSVEPQHPTRECDSTPRAILVRISNPRYNLGSKKLKTGARSFRHTFIVATRTATLTQVFSLRLSTRILQCDGGQSYIRSPEVSHRFPSQRNQKNMNPPSQKRTLSLKRTIPETLIPNLHCTGSLLPVLSLAFPQLHAATQPSEPALQTADFPHLSPSGFL
ncbi:hypothetical protein K440DRAFT_622515 [Wilcoxina mikolae CBS 423.85]|nr:hypothetical protein K440DRAFT_622515 [Wilcoxina mikolae CBS 423.85]